jgi:hypothetical protein
MGIDVSPEEQAIATRVITTMLRPGAQPPQLRREFERITECHAHLMHLGFRLVQKQKNYGGPSLPGGRPVGAHLLWRCGRILVRIKPRGNKPASEHRAGLAHMSVCLLSGAMAGGRPDTSLHAEIAKFDDSGRLVANGTRNPHAKDPWQARAWEDDRADARHFLFADLVCDDRDVDGLRPWVVDA